MAAMHCPSCDKLLGRDEYYAGEDEKSDGNLYPYAYWICRACETQIHDWEDEFEYAEWDKDAPQTTG
jgi:hypothetical protein